MTARWKRIATRSMSLAKDKNTLKKVLKPANAWKQRKNNKPRLTNSTRIDLASAEVVQ